eukprot:3867498-Rhodomonas_salina.1
MPIMHMQIPQNPSQLPQVLPWQPQSLLCVRSFLTSLLAQNGPLGDQPYFDSSQNRLVVPRAGFIPGARRVPSVAVPSQRGAPRQVDTDEKAQAQLLKKLKERLLTDQKFQKDLAGQLEQETDQKGTVLESKWFGLPANTYGAGIWSILVLEVEATRFFDES